jgi:hypothetical protein
MHWRLLRQLSRVIFVAPSQVVDGQHHTVSPQYLHQYATHAAWIEDNRRLDNGALANRALGLALAHKVSCNWKGYWQRHISAKEGAWKRVGLQPDLDCFYYACVRIWNLLVRFWWRTQK